MKLVCTVFRSDRQFPSLALPSKRAATSALSIGQATSGGDICILHQAQSSKEGTKYKVKGNIKKIHTKFLHEGKATISFAAPPHDLIINTGDAVQLKSFLKVLHSAIHGKPLSRGGGGLSTLVPGSAPKVQKPKTRLSVTSKSEYPVLEGFPRTLNYLQINIDQKRFDERLLRLQLLRVLDLSYNRLQVLPKGLGDLPNLVELYLQKNLLGTSALHPGAWDWLRGSAIPKTLKLLNLSLNEIPAIPNFLGDLRCLTTLKLDNNKIQVLHSSVGRMPYLQVLTVSHNQLRFLPGSMIKLHLDTLDISSNPFGGECETTEFISRKICSLKELAARIVIRHRFAVSEAIVPATVLRFMQGCDFCLCGDACFNPASSKVIHYDTMKIANSVSKSSGESSHKPFRVCACSDRCFKHKLFSM